MGTSLANAGRCGGRATIATLASLTLAVFASRAAADPLPYTALSPTGQAAAAAPSTPPVLTSEDASAYAEGFAAVRKGRFEAVEATAHRVGDATLMGRLAFMRLMHPAYRATLDELKGWLAHYGAEPEADRVYTLAMKKQGGKAAADAPLPPTKDADPRLQAAREAFYGGQVQAAHDLAVAAGEQWIGGLSAFRLGLYDEAIQRFSRLADDGARSAWVRSAAAFWAARAAVAAGQPELAPAFLQKAAANPTTFYGLIAERQLGLDAAISPASATGGAIEAEAAPALETVGGFGDAPAAQGLMAADARAHRAAAFAQIGLGAEAAREVRTAFLGAGSDDDRRQWSALAARLNASLASSGGAAAGGPPGL